MKKWEIDWRFSSTKRILQALSDGLKDTEREIDKAEEEYQIDDAREYIEGLLGIAFVTAQTYIARTVSDAKRLNKAGGSLTKEQLLKNYSGKLDGASVTKMQICDAIANYYKHHDESSWSWDNPDSGHQTVRILLAANINKKDTFPCSTVADMLWSNSGGLNLEPLLSLISNWRKSVIAAHTG